MQEEFDLVSASAKKRIREIERRKLLPQNDPDYWEEEEDGK
jgi:hypothetical protein